MLTCAKKCYLIRKKLDIFVLDIFVLDKNVTGHFRTGLKKTGHFRTYSFFPRISPGQIRDELEDCAAETADPGKTTRDILQKHAAKTYYNERGSGGGGGGAGGVGPEGRRRRSTFSDEARLPDRIDGSKSVAKPGNSSPARAGVGGGGGSGGNGGGGGGASSVSRYTRETKPSVLALEAKRDPNNFETLKKCWNHKFADPNKISIHVRPNQEGGIDFVIFVRFFMGGIFLRFHF